MKSIIITTALLLIQSFGFAQKNFIDQNYITVFGKAEMEITPDEIYITFLINEDDKKGKVSVEKQEAELYKELKKINIDINKSLKVQRFNSDYQKFLLKKDDVIKTKKYELMAHTTTDLEKIFEILEKLEISNAYISKIDHSEIEKYRKEVKINAIKAAKAKADYLTSSIGQSIGNAIHIQEMNNEVSSVFGGQVHGLLSNTYAREYAAESSLDKPEFSNIVIKEIMQVNFTIK